MPEGLLLMTQAERDRLVSLKKAKKKLITQKEAAAELGITERQVRLLLRELKGRGDQVVAHGLRGLPSNRKISADTEQKAVTSCRSRCTGDLGRRWRQSTCPRNTTSR
jgi:biotin operon repressor